MTRRHRKLSESKGAQQRIVEVSLSGVAHVPTKLCNRLPDHYIPESSDDRHKELPYPQHSSLEVLRNFV
jgi:hypothetical protein